MRVTSGPPAGRQLSECSLMGKAAQLMTLCGAIEVRILPFRFPRWSRWQLARAYPWRSRVRDLFSLCYNDFINIPPEREAPVVRWVLFFYGILLYNKQHRFIILQIRYSRGGNNCLILICFSIKILQQLI